MSMISFDDRLRQMAKDPTSAAMTAVVDRVRDGLDDDQVVSLAQTLASSGVTFEPSAQAADVASTGGPSSLSTILTPLILADNGVLAIKLGVPGRPAGGLDVMANVPGFQSVLDIGGVRRALAKSRVAHLAAAGPWTPLDGALFAHRKAVGAVDIPELVMASLLSKKLAVGLASATVEVRVSARANFGPTNQLALDNARRFVAVAALAGVSVTCCLTDATIPYQRRIGRAESLDAVRLLLYNDAPPADLVAHLDLCARLTSEAIGGGKVVAEPSRLRSRFARHLKAQGTSLDAFDRRVAECRDQVTATVDASAAGHLRVDLMGIREVLVREQQLVETPDYPYPDPSGVTLLADPGDQIEVGQPLAVVRTADSGRIQSVVDAMRDHIDSQGAVAEIGPRMLAVVRNSALSKDAS
jgi:thymidine phosphorylase